MFRYLMQRILTGAGALFTVATLTFVLMHAVPGDPLRQEKNVPESVRHNLVVKYGLDRPLLEQYGRYMSGMFLHGDFGISFKQENITVNQIIRDHFWVSALLGMLALSFAIIVGPSLGTLAALFRNRTPDNLAMLVAVAGISIPSFVLAYFLQYLLAEKLKLLPSGGWDTPQTMILPSLSLGMIVMASMARLMRSSMLEVIQQDYVRTARAKGLSLMQIIIRHQIRNAILPVVVYIGPLFAAILTGSFVIENIFGIPGLGQFFVNSVQELDYTVIMGLTVFFSGFAIVVILGVDLIYGLIDPRIRLARK
jgi:ABC-type dipeptide/oligopeptide/nickel transport system permease component